ncbi:hypothetical protein BDF21DRAFT_465502 [Thamnidium elegans]|nr:hypothetical protein BDF21DRAFT_465502 [Thamnidium elegans]
MGFCIYCNKNVYSSTSCPKCFRTISNTSKAESRVTAMFPDQKRLNQTNADKWQTMYSKKAIFDNAQGSTSASVRNKRTIPQFNLAKYDYSKCIMCQGGSWAEFHNNSSVIVCEPCKKSAQSSPLPESSSISTPVLSSMATSRSTLTSSTKTNPYFQFQRTRRASMLNRTQLDDIGMGPTPVSTVSTSAIIQSPPQSPILNRITEELTNKCNLNYRRTEKTQPKTDMTSSLPPIAPPRTKKKVVKKPCQECGQHVSKRDYRGLKIPSGKVLCYHHDCLFCAKCNQNFDCLDFCTDGKKFYHTECPQSRHGSPLSEEEEEAYPATPPPHETHFDIAVQGEVPKNDALHKKKEVPDSTTDVMCSTCTLPVIDSTCLELANNFYHKECLLCAGCNKTVPTDKKLSKYKDKLYCGSCKPTHQRPIQNLRIQIENEISRPPIFTTPSDILKSRKKVLPQLGGVRTCARCNQSMPVSDIQPGPGASRWHKKCLRCTRCKKQMDSDAHMTTNEDTGLCLVHCRECLDETPKPRFVR